MGNPRGTPLAGLLLLVGAGALASGMARAVASTPYEIPERRSIGLSKPASPWHNSAVAGFVISFSGFIGLGCGIAPGRAPPDRLLAIAWHRGGRLLPGYTGRHSTGRKRQLADGADGFAGADRIRRGDPLDRRSGPAQRGGSRLVGRRRTAAGSGTDRISTANVPRQHRRHLSTLCLSCACCSAEDWLRAKKPRKKSASEPDWPRSASTASRRPLTARKRR